MSLSKPSPFKNSLRPEKEGQRGRKGGKEWKTERVHAWWRVKPRQLISMRPRVVAGAFWSGYAAALSCAESHAGVSFCPPRANKQRESPPLQIKQLKRAAPLQRCSAGEWQSPGVAHQCPVCVCVCVCIKREVFECQWYVFCFRRSNRFLRNCTFHTTLLLSRQPTSDSMQFLQSVILTVHNVQLATSYSPATPISSQWRASSRTQPLTVSISIPTWNPFRK